MVMVMVMVTVMVTSEVLAAAATEDLAMVTMDTEGMYDLNIRERERNRQPNGKMHFLK